MELLRELTEIQHRRGYLDDETLRALAVRKRVPLYQLEGLVSFYPAFRRTPPPNATVEVCRDVVCSMAGRETLRQQLAQRLDDRDDVELREVSCLGRCDAAAAVAINDQPVAPATLADIDHLLELIDDPSKLAQRQPQELTAHSWRCDPYKDERSHYSTVKSLLAAGQDLAAVCTSRLKESRLRGLGGAGFPTGQKWELVAAQEAEPKYVICNADESEPGTFKDRVILAELPHLVLEGMLLAGLAVGAQRGIIYLRHEYAREQRSLEAALAVARQRGVLGTDAAGSGRPFDVEIFVSPGGYILGEETALLEALEDKRGEPRNKPPYPSTHGLWGKPTLINNVETLAMATTIIHRGPRWWHEQGRGECSGLKFVSVSGDVERPGVYEIPLGTTVAELIGQAGGMKDGRPLQAFLPGGASSNFLPAAAADTPLDFEAMKRAGSMLGTGAVIVFAEGRDLFALATNLVRFFRNESCGKCVPCRVGSEKAVELLDGVRAGDLPASDLDVLPELDDTLEQTSICGLGQVALKPVLSMMKHFPAQAPRGEGPK